MGMNTATLKAVDQRTRSVSTANTRPRTVARVGAMMTQMKLFLSAVRVDGEAKISW